MAKKRPSACGIDATKREIAVRSHHGGYESLSFSEAKRRVEALGYKLKFSFNYANRYSPPACWDASHYQVEDRRTGRSFAHVDQRNPNLPRLQELRNNALVIRGKRIVEF